ncbi:glycosyltransferase family protein [Ekhidna sp. To15]|uniref:glycosyltransferase family protein n=1 Tax=Ekhidna sp. To15 TaxID=3395267 RepID=UPI003F51B895
MKYIFIVQGEGRGHMTQAISLFQILKENGHDITHVIVGKSKNRELPKFFIDQIESPVSQLESPNFVTDKNARSVNVFKTLTTNLRKYRTFVKSVNQIDTIVKKEKPDVIINFYDFLSGLYFMLKRPKVKHVALAHQFLLNHSTFEFPKGRFYDKSSLLVGNRLAAYGADKILGLSFQPMADEPGKKLFVVPPLLREKAKTIKPSLGDHFLVYMVNHGYSSDVKAFHAKHPEIPIHCFWDKKDEPNELKADETLTFHRLDDDKFIQMMASCRGYLTTAGFESVCEAMYMGKPILMVPVKGHYEQACNALDAKKAGAGVSSEIFDLEVLLNYLPQHNDVGDKFRNWCETSAKRFLEMLT